MARWMTRRRTIASLAGLLLVGALVAAGLVRLNQRAAAAAGTRAPVALEFTAADVASVEARSLTRWLRVSGTLQPVNQTTVKSKVSGDIRQVMVRDGESVKAGQIIARLDTADLEAKLADRIGALESTRAQLALAEKTRAQNLALLRQKFISQTAFDSAESNLSVNQGLLKSNEAQVQLARNALRDAVVVAPLSGTVAKRHVQPGEKVNFDSPLFTVVDLGRMELQAMVPANDIPEIAVGMPVDLSIDGFGERRFSGTVERINPTTETGTRAILVFVRIPNPDAALKGGMFATGRIKLDAAAPVPTLPATAVRTEAGQTFVWTVDHGKLARRSVSVGAKDEASGLIELKSALPYGAVVLASPFDNLKDGAPALVRAAESPASTTAKRDG